MFLIPFSMKISGGFATDMPNAPKEATPLLFVNKSTTSSSLSDSNAEERNKIHSHVQKWRKQQNCQLTGRPPKSRPLKTFKGLG